MNYGGIAAIIAALAFAVFVGSLVMSLIKLPKLINDLQLTVQRINTTIDVVTKDVDGLAVEVEALLNKTNSLMDDVNRKIGKVDPLFTAVGDLGETVSEINDTAKDSATNFISGLGRRRKSRFSKFTRGAKALTKVKDFVTPVDKDTTRVEEVLLDPQVEAANRVSVEKITINKGEGIDVQ